MTYITTLARSHSAKRLLFPALVASALLAGCAGNPLRSYDKEMGDTMTLLKQGNLDGALAQLESNNTSIFDKKKEGKDKTALDSPSGKDILYYFEKGELLRLSSEYEPSRNTWLQADEIVQVWEDEYRANPTKVISDIGAFLVSDRVRRYDGQDYEKVFLSTKLMLNHIMLGNTELARIEMKKTFERETLIKNFREQEINKIREEGKKQSISFMPKDLLENGYPMDRLEGSEVNALKNGYQNAFAHYLAGYYFEMMGEPSLSAPGYRNALELRPDSTLVRAKTTGKTAKPGPNEADVLFVFETGQAPAWKSVTLPLVLPVNKQPIIVPLSFPVVISSGVYTPASLNVGGKNLLVETIVNVDAMAKRQLKDQLPGIIGRTAIRGIVKGAVQYVAQNQAGSTGGLVAQIATVVTEQADERSWRTLPARLSIARAVLPEGEQMVEFRTDRGIYRGTISVGGKVNIVPIRIIDNFVYIGQKEAKGSFTELPSSNWAKLEEDESIEAIQARVSAVWKPKLQARLAADAKQKQSTTRANNTTDAKQKQSATRANDTTDTKQRRSTTWENDTTDTKQRRGTTRANDTTDTKQRWWTTRTNDTTDTKQRRLTTRTNDTTDTKQRRLTTRTNDTTDTKQRRGTTRANNTSTKAKKPDKDSDSRLSQRKPFRS